MRRQQFSAIGREDPRARDEGLAQESPGVRPAGWFSISMRRNERSNQQTLRARAEREARYMADLERVSWSACLEQCRSCDRTLGYIRQRLAEISSGARERFAGERKLAEYALPQVEQWALRFDVIYTVLSFANLRDRWRYLRGSDAEREALIREVLERGGVFTDRGCFQEILR